MLRTTVEQVVGVCVSGLRVVSCCLGGDDKASKGGGLTVDTILGCIDENTTSAPLPSGLKPEVEHLAGTAPSVLLEKSSQLSASCLSSSVSSPTFGLRPSVER
jgi:hypothetical protein